MKVLNYSAAIFLLAVTFIGCSDEFDLDLSSSFPGYSGSTGVITQVTLNPTEQRLKGEWFLRSMATSDTLYNDSIENRKLTIRFTEFANPGETLPSLHDHLRLFAKATLDSAWGLVVDETYQAPDSATLIIHYKGGLYQPVLGNIQFQITKLALYHLNLRDSITGKEWKFER